jgi:hypothetical protein
MHCARKQGLKAGVALAHFQAQLVDSSLTQRGHGVTTPVAVVSKVQQQGPSSIVLLNFCKTWCPPSQQQ